MILEDGQSREVLEETREPSIEYSKPELPGDDTRRPDSSFLTNTKSDVTEMDADEPFRSETSGGLRTDQSFEMEALVPVLRRSIWVFETERKTHCSDMFRRHSNAPEENYYRILVNTSNMSRNLAFKMLFEPAHAISTSIHGNVNEALNKSASFSSGAFNPDEGRFAKAGGLPSTIEGVSDTKFRHR